MPIHRLINSVRTGLDGLPRLGKLRKGAAKPVLQPGQKARPGQALTYFRMTFDREYEYLQPAWEKMYGTSPEFFDPVYVAGSTADEAFTNFMEEWTATTLIRRCDSLEQIRHYDAATDSWSEEPKMCAQLCQQTCACKQIGRLNLIFLDFSVHTGALGYITVETHSTNDITTMVERLNAYERMFGSLDGVQFKFGRVAREISRPKDSKTGKRSRINKSLFFLDISPEYTKRELFGLIGGARPAALLPAPEPIAPERLAAQKARLGNGGPRRIGAPEPPTSQGLPLPDIDDVTEGDFEEDDEPDDLRDGDSAGDSLSEVWTVETLKPFVIDLFKNDPNYYAGVKNYRDAEHDEFMLPPDITLAEAEARVRFYRSRTGKAEMRIFEDDSVREKFIGACSDLVDDDRAIVEALDAVTDYPVPGLTAWRGDKGTAWAAVVAAAALYVVRMAIPDNAKPVTAALIALVCEHVTGLNAEDADTAPATATA